ncbi:NAD(P)-binding protein, partial [Schizophyllum commune Loenen D]
EMLVAMAAKYSEGLPGYVDASTLPRYIAPASHSPPKYPVTVLLTGSTGHLGSEILASLLTDERVEMVYTLDRAGKGNSLDRARKGASLDRAGRGVSDGATAGVRDRQRTRWADKGLDDELLQSPKLAPLEGDVSAPRFGQSEEVYSEMLASVSVIIHTAWRVNFNHPLDAFESSVKGVRALVGFAREASRGLAGCSHARSLRFLFTSSTTAARSWEDVAILGRAPVPESLIDDPGVCIGGGGYAQSKYVAERVLAASGLQFASSRGASATTQRRAAWATSSWLPILFETSVTLGALPDGAEQTVPWLPIDTAARALVDIALSASPLYPSYNVVHPRPISWSQMMRYFQRSLALVLGKEVPLVSFEEWIARLETVACSMTVNAQRGAPGIALLPAFRDIGGALSQTFAMDKALAVSPTLRNAAPISQADVDGWVRYWMENGLFGRQAAGPRL